MMRGPSYDDSYISRKITQMPGPTFNAPGPVSYGRPPIGGYIQDPYGYDYIPRRRKTKTTRAEARSLSPEIPYLWPEVDNSFMERKARKGWYRVDFGPHRATETRYLPTTRDRLNFLRRYAEPIAYSSYSPPRASSVPPPVKSVKTIRYPRYSSYWTTPRYHSSVLIPYRRPRSISYSYWYYPTLGPYSGRLWTSARHLSPLAGRARSLSPVRVSTSWSDSYTSPYSSYSATTTYSPDSTEVREERRSVSPAPASYRPSAATQLILNRVALRTPRSSVSPLVRGYPQFGPPPPPVRIVPRLPPPSYYDYGGYYSYVPLQPRISRYDSYLDDELPEPAYIPRYRPRVADTLDDADFRERSLPHLTTTTTTTTTTPRTTAHTRGYSPGAPAPATRAVTTGEGEDSLALVPFRGRTAGRLRPHLQSLPRQETVPGETEGERHLARLAHRYPSLSEPQMLQDHVDKMRIRLKSLAYSLDPTGPVPEIILPERHKKSAAIDDKKYSSGPKHLACVEFAGGQPQWKRKARARYPAEDPEHVATLVKAEYVDAEEAPEKEQKEQEKLILKDRLSNRIHQFFNSTLNAEQFDKYLKTYRQPGPKLPHAQVRGGFPSARLYDSSAQVMPDTSSRYTKLTSKWEEPDTVFGAPSDKKPYSKVETGSSFFSTYGYTNRKKDYVAEKAITDGAAEEGSEEKKERRKKKKSKEREVVPEVATVEAVSSTPAPPAAAPAEVSVPEAEPVSAPTESEPAEDEEKERKRLEKKKRKAEREAAAKAAMEAELAALAAAEAELARLEAESSSLKPEAPAAEVSAPAEVPAAPAEPAAEVKSESAAEKSSEPSKAKRKLQSATSKILAVGAFFRSNKTQKQPSAE
ncbi:uncharacterized protein [Cherax quadricarinatus]|uniref:uncharacterized protein isoform X5 n=1 Tax=Cherax quadricarinatus TaxID=27406 RepID=UPI002378E555|nr:uncharacterized protein LOC128691358 isoform X5 [Cherax quadricarinatus]